MSWSVCYLLSWPVCGCILYIRMPTNMHLYMHVCISQYPKSSMYGMIYSNPQKIEPSFLSAGDHTIPCGTPATHGRCEFGRGRGRRLGRGPRRLGCLGRCLLSSGCGAIHGSQCTGLHQQSTSSVAGPERCWMAWLLDLSDRSDRL